MLLPIAHAATESAGGIAALGLDARALLFQVINFGLLLVLLRLFAYKPVLKVLEARRQRVEESLRSAEEVSQAKTELERRVQETTADAGRQAQAIIQAGQARADTIIKEAEMRAREAADRIEEQAKAHVTQQIAAARNELKREMLELVAAATARIIGERLDTQRDEALITNAVAAAEEHLKQTRS
jgi:F-type H+-transporting ATPase subunit b